MIKRQRYVSLVDTRALSQSYITKFSFPHFNQSNKTIQNHDNPTAHKNRY